MTRRIDGNNTIYHYLQKAIIPRDDAFSRELILRLIVDLSIWFPPELYCAVPILLPYCVRDAAAKSKDWGSASPSGYLRDNNSILKLLPGSYKIRGTRFAVYDKAERGRGFIAAHIWRHICLDGEKLLTPTHARTYSFIPNVCWLPQQIAKLTDHEGSYAQQVLQALSHQLYSAAHPDLPAEIAAVWQALPAPALKVEIDPATLNTFAVSPRAISLRRSSLTREMDIIESTIESGAVTQRSPRSFRYLSTLVQLPREQTATLRNWLAAYTEFLAR